jgi:hypothetical protein
VEEKVRGVTILQSRRVGDLKAAYVVRMALGSRDTMSNGKLRAYLCALVDGVPARERCGRNGGAVLGPT